MSFVKSPQNLTFTTVFLCKSSSVLQCFAWTFPKRLSYSILTESLLFYLARNSACWNKPFTTYTAIYPLACPEQTNISFFSPILLISRQVTALAFTLLSYKIFISCSELSKSRTVPSELPTAKISSNAAIEYGTPYATLMSPWKRSAIFLNYFPCISRRPGVPSAPSLCSPSF